MTFRLDQHRTALSQAIRQIEADLEENAISVDGTAADDGAPASIDNPLAKARARVIDALAIIDAALAEAPPPASATSNPAECRNVGVPIPELTQIRGVDEAMAAKLKLAGVHSVREIACWTAADVQRLKAVLDLGRRISKENWIEQAALLGNNLTSPVLPVPAPPHSDPAPVTEPDAPAPLATSVERLASPVCFLLDFPPLAPLAPLAVEPAAPDRMSEQAEARTEADVAFHSGPADRPAPWPAPRDDPAPLHHETLQARLERLDRLAAAAQATGTRKEDNPNEIPPPPAPTEAADDPDIARFLERRRAAKVRRSGLATLRDSYSEAGTLPEPENAADLEPAEVVAIVSRSPRGPAQLSSPVTIVEPLDPGGPVRDGPLTALPVEDRTGRNLAFAEEASVEIVRRRPADKPKYDWLAGSKPEGSTPPVAGRFLKSPQDD